MRLRLVERDAEIDLLMLQWGHSCKQLENSVATAYRNSFYGVIQRETAP